MDNYCLYIPATASTVPLCADIRRVVVAPYAIVSMHIELTDPFAVSYDVYVHAHARMIMYIWCRAPGALEVSVRVHEHASADVRIAYVAYHALRINTQQYHVQAHTDSRVTVKGITFEAADVIYSGTVHMPYAAAYSHASQYHGNITMSERARVRSSPALQIQARTVKCTHASALGTWDVGQLQYIYTRGYDVKKAQQLLLRSFFSQMMVPPSFYEHESC